jgi:hypothetical protein
MLGIDGPRQLEVTAYCVHSFFDAYLKGAGGSRLRIASPRYPEIQVLPALGTQHVAAPTAVQRQAVRREKDAAGSLCLAAARSGGRPGKNTEILILLRSAVSNETSCAPSGLRTIAISRQASENGSRHNRWTEKPSSAKVNSYRVTYRYDHTPATAIAIRPAMMRMSMRSLFQYIRTGKTTDRKIARNPIHCQVRGYRKT